MSKITKRTIISGIIAIAGYSVFSAVKTGEPMLDRKEIALAKDSIVSVQAFEKVYAVLMSPRCMNCHPAGDIPLQGDDSHLHEMNPKRGPDGKGMLAMKCANCHQPENTEGPHAPPGHPEWHLPPEDMKMVFEGRTPHWNCNLK
ncbi:hypothetical protein [Olivibacter sp. SDN3]|uniref:hypothetical protein n=1 Tax=Olivibacter sp. SDN3 TaxID=2764720 RepID=UPI001C9E4737|nr:hypothetical protein [Olivibacter sp. SDN3]